MNRKARVAGYKYDWLRVSTSMIWMEQVEGTLVWVSSWWQLRGKTREKGWEKLKKIGGDIDAPGVAGGMVDLPMNTQTLRHCCKHFIQTLRSIEMLSKKLLCYPTYKTCLSNEAEISFVFHKIIRIARYRKDMNKNKIMELLTIDKKISKLC